VKAGFNPDQPRVPAGRPDGGQWTRDGGAGGRAELVQARPGSRYLVKLEEEEGVKNGHTIRDHVGKSPEFLRQRIADSQEMGLFVSRGRYRAGSFPSIEAANKLVNSTLAQNLAIVDQVASGAILDRVFVTATFRTKTGIEAFLPVSERRRWFLPSKIASIYIRDTYGVGVVIYHDPTAKNGFRVLTAYPRND